MIESNRTPEVTEIRAKLQDGRTYKVNINGHKIFKGCPEEFEVLLNSKSVVVANGAHILLLLPDNNKCVKGVSLNEDRGEEDIIGRVIERYELMD